MTLRTLRKALRKIADDNMLSRSTEVVVSGPQATYDIQEVYLDTGPDGQPNLVIVIT
jgi:hypothetical protein